MANRSSGTIRTTIQLDRLNGLLLSSSAVSAEPTAALDSKSGRDVVNLMQKLAREQGSTILMVTHDNRILDVADRIVHMEDGGLVDNAILQKTV